MHARELIAKARAGQFGPVHVLAGAEVFLIERAVSLLRAAATRGGIQGFNEDLFHGKGLAADRVLGAARTLPMMAATRFVLVRGLDEMGSDELDALVPYVESPCASTCLVGTAERLDGRTRFARAAKKVGVLAEAEPLKGPLLREFAIAEAAERGHTLEDSAASALVDAIGSDLGALDDALERLSLYVGPTRPITADAVAAVVTRIRVETIWTLVDAVSDRDAPRALGAAGSLVADREPPLRILAMLARQLRSVARMREALATGLKGPEAAKHAGVPPFKVREMTDAARKFTVADLARAFSTLAATDALLKGSKRPPETVLEEAVLRLCRGAP